MNFLSDLTSEHSSLAGGYFVELSVDSHDPSIQDRLQCRTLKGGKVVVQFLNGVPPVIETGSILSIWDFDRSTDRNDLIIRLDLKGPSQWVVRQPSGVLVEPKFAEFCCGLGGWTQGLRCLMGQDDFKPLILLDNDLVVASTCAKTLGMELLTLEQAFQLVCQGQLPSNVVIHGDLFDKKIWCLVGLLKVQHLCMSTPCPPWSGAARALGLASKDGRALAYAVYMSRIAGIKVIELENVPGITRHEHFQDLKTFFTQQGFSFAHSGTFEVYPLLPLKRERWIAALVADHLKPPLMAAQWVENVKFPKISFGPPQLAHQDCILDTLSLYEVQELTPQTNAFLKMSNLQYLPKNMKHRQGQSVLMSRCIGGSDHMVAVMASYGKQHELPDDILKEKGLYTVLFFDKEKSLAPRYLSPWEIISTMAWPDTLHLPKDVHDCWKAVGNSIAIPHVILGLFKTHAALLEKSPWGTVIFNLSELLEKMSSKRIRLSKVQQKIVETRFLEARNLVGRQEGLATVQDLFAGFDASHASAPPPNDVNNGPQVGLLFPLPPASHEAAENGHFVDPTVSASVAPVVESPPVGRHGRISRDPLWDAVKAVEGCSRIDEHDVPTTGTEVIEDCTISRSTLKRVWNADDTWGFEMDPLFQCFKTDENDVITVDPSKEQWGIWDVLFNEAINKSGIDKVWPMSRILMLVSHGKGWFRVTAVEHQQTVLAMIRTIIPHAESRHFHKVWVDGNDVTPSSIPPGLHKIVIACQLHVFSINILVSENRHCTMECDITTKGLDVLKKIEVDFNLHVSCCRLMANGMKVGPSCFILSLKESRFEVVKEVAVTLPGELPVAKLPGGLPFPPDHSDLFSSPCPMTIRVTTRHPIWSSVRTVLVSVEKPVHHMLALLLPDMRSSCELSLWVGGMRIDDHASVKSINWGVKHEINFGSSKPLPVTEIEFIMPTPIVDQMQIGSLERAGDDPVKRWIRSPFQSKSYEKVFPKDMTLVNLAAQYMAHSSSAQTLLTLVDGKCVDPRLNVGQIAPSSVITIRCCPVVGGTKKNEDVKKMLQQQLLARGVQDADVSARVESILSCVAPEKLRTFVADTWNKQWDGIKNLANEGKIRLVTVDELKSFQKNKKLSKPTDNKSGVGSASSTATGSSLGSSASKLVKKSSLHEVNVDLTYFRADGQEVVELAAESFGPDAKGVAIMHFESAQRFLPPTKLSADYLAIIAIGNVKSNLKGTSDFKMIPATDAVGNPILVPATIINFGDVVVSFEERNSAKIASQAAMVVEFSIWKSEVESWDAVKSPMLFLGQSFPEIKNATIMGSWALKSYGANKRPVEHAKADYSHGFFRVLVAEVDPLLSRSGWNGTYFTPKNEAKRPHPDYMVINVPNHDIKQMKALAQKTLNCLGIVKMPQCLALRCRREHGHLVMKSVFPDMPQPDIGHFEQGDDLYILKHINVNVKASELSAALQEWGWEGSRAIRPVGSMAWMVAAKKRPPSAHLSINGSFAVVVPHQKTAQNTVKGPMVPSTAAFKTNQVTPTPMECNAEKNTSRLDEIKVSMQGQVQATIDAKLAAQNSQIEMLQRVVQDTTNDVRALKDSQIATEHRIVGVEQAVQASTSSLLNQMSSMFTSLQSALTDRLDKFEARHDAEEAKRQRTS